MKIVQSAGEMQEFSEAERRLGRRIAFVPTMGYFHEGHLNLMRIGRKRGDCLIVSIYVNPAQFAPTEDLDAYPRDFERDQKLAEGVDVDVIFCPDNREMYPEGYQTHVEVEGTTNNLCGISRPRFFRGVTTVCTKLFHIVKPHVTIFGKKDFQQYVTIRRMVRDLNMDIEVVGMDTTREPDGLAMSSRNVYLNPEERKSALCLSRSLDLAQELYDNGERDVSSILGKVRAWIAGYPHTEIDYAQICDVKTMKDAARIEGECVLALAVRVGKTRLIDNRVFGESMETGKRRFHAGGR
ncbi:MAG: pantoate--beta-alanine ligase [Proteobacteria bacterium]|nr:pantoate--beta-alanine ligase [Pseudomonadota bacterium]MBU4583257.1 pantoate--beta-alanine ligase [Pseudomonadota bacterium]MCG2738835.1 pantoate--beta-alanine ligase [Syntrophaceae bacterium]